MCCFYFFNKAEKCLFLSLNIRERWLKFYARFFRLVRVEMIAQKLVCSIFSFFYFYLMLQDNNLIMLSYFIPNFCLISIRSFFNFSFSFFNSSISLFNCCTPINATPDGSMVDMVLSSFPVLNSL